MNRAQLEHVIRASSDICEDDEVIIIGSQAILASFSDAPHDLLVSMEADVIPKNKPDRAIDIDGTMGELSPFHTTFGYYAHGVAQETAVLAKGWRERLVPISNPNTLGRTGWCLSPTDTAISKLAAGRDKDMRFVTSLLQHRLITSFDIGELAETGLSGDAHDTVLRNLDLCKAKEIRP